VFIELHNARPSGGMGPSQLTFEAFDAYTRVTGSRLAGWETRALKCIDSAWFKVQNEQSKSKNS